MMGTTATLLAGLASALSPSPAPAFARKPAAFRDGPGVRIEFAADRPTDVAVEILDARGRVVRHLAAGLLGPNAPAPLQRDALAQRLAWDGKDDAGRPAGPGPFAARIGLGLRPAFDGFIGYNPQVLESVRGLTVDRKGEVYVLNVIRNIHGGDGTTVCQVFDRRGRYVRTILPYPANLPDGKLRGLRRLRLSDGSRVPFIHQAETRSFYPGVGEIPRQRPVVTRDGRLAFVGIQEYGRYAQPGVNRLVVIHTDGSVPPEGVLGPRIAERVASAASLALSPDETWIYATGLYDGYRGTYWEKCKWHHVVYRFRWTDEAAEPFLGTLHESGRDPRHFDDPRSVATDPRGRIYVADRGNDRIAIFAPEGAYRGEVKVEKPSWVEIHPRTGALYVLAGAPLNLLLKLSGPEDARVEARCRLPNRIDGGRRHLWPVMALDPSAEPPVLWIGAPSHYCEFGLLRIEDRGDGFGEPVDVTRLGEAGPSVGFVTDLSLDRRGRRLHVRGRGFFDARTGEPLPLRLPRPSGSGPIGAFGADGNFYVYEGYPSAFLRRYGPDLEPLPFRKAGDRIPDLGSPRVHGRGITADREGAIYVLYQKGQAEQRPGDARDANALNVYGPDGTLKRARLVDAQVRQIHSVRVDRGGNIYLAAGLRPGDALVPPEIAPSVSDLQPYAYGIPPLELNWYPLLYGSIIKFPPGGGRIGRGVGGRRANYAYGTPIEVDGALWIRPGASIVPSWRTKGTPDVCLCVPVRFDLDPFGRVFHPDAARFRVGVLDAQGNLIAHFGSYGNQDSAGPGSAIPEPAIPFAWPQAVAADGRAVYVADQLNRRIVRVALGYREEARCRIE